MVNIELEIVDACRRSIGAVHGQCLAVSQYLCGASRDALLDLG
jgi:hypothetical protein